MFRFSSLSEAQVETRDFPELAERKNLATESVLGSYQPDMAMKIWIDLENTPHVPFFKPVARELEKRNCKVVYTVRDAYQTCEMASSYGLKFTRVGHHYEIGRAHV